MTMDEMTEKDERVALLHRIDGGKCPNCAKLVEAIKEALDEDCGGHAQAILVEALGHDPRTRDR